MRALIFVLLAWSMALKADVTPLIFTPTNPTEASYISISGQTRHCEIISVAPPIIERMENVIRVRVRGAVAQNTVFCFFGGIIAEKWRADFLKMASRVRSLKMQYE